MSNSKHFYNFVIPSIGAMLVTGLYFVVDGIFVGRGVGLNGLASVNIAVPFISILTAVTMMITMGGATLTSICLGKKQIKQANNYFNISLLFVFIFSLSLTIISLVFSKQIALLLGASDILLNGTAQYIKYYVMFGIFFCGSMSLSVFVRNDGNPRLAFWGMIVGAVTNIFLDWLFIFPLGMGIKGAAIASGLGQFLACITLCTHFIQSKGNLKIQMPKVEFEDIKNIIKVGSPEFITQMSQPVTIFCFNIVVMHFYQEIGVSAFSIISYILIIIFSIFIGLAQGIQPLISHSYGTGDKEKEQYFFNKGLYLNVILALIVYVIMLVFGKSIITIFNNEPTIIDIGYNCIQIYGMSFLFAAINIVYTTYFLATKNTKKAMFIAIARSFVFNSIFIFMLPILFGIDYLWSGMIIAEFVVMLIALLLKINSKTNNFI